MAHITLSEAAKRFGITKQGVLNRVKSGKLEGVQVDGRWLIQLHDVDTDQAEDHQQVDDEVTRLRVENVRLQQENACLKAKVDGMEVVLTAFSSGELIGKLTELTATLTAQQAPKALPESVIEGNHQADRRRRFLFWRW